MKISNPRTIHALLTDQPKTRKQLSEESGLTVQQVRFAVRGMTRYGQAVETDEGVTKGPKEFRRQWASPQEKQAHYAKQYRERAMADTGEMGRKFRATQKRNEERRKLREITARAKEYNQQERARKAQERHKKAGRVNVTLEPRKPSVIELAPPNPVLMTSDEWVAQGNQIEILPSQLGMAYSGLRGPAMNLY